MEKIIVEQFWKFHNGIDRNRIIMSFLDELISLGIMIYDKNEEGYLKKTDIIFNKDIRLEELDWKIENGYRIPYYSGKKIKSIKFEKGDEDVIQNYIS